MQQFSIFVGLLSYAKSAINSKDKNWSWSCLSNN